MNVDQLNLMLGLLYFLEAVSPDTQTGDGDLDKATERIERCLAEAVNAVRHWAGKRKKLYGDRIAT